MPALRQLLSSTVAAVATLGLSNSVLAQSPPAAARVHGTIAVHGCVVEPVDVLVRARPVVSPGPSFIQHATLSSEGFEFDFRDVTPGALYKVGVKLLGPSASRCRHIVWDVDRDPLVIPGEPDLRFDAYAARSEFAVLGVAEGHRAPVWVAADSLDFDSVDPARSVRLFRWRTTLPNVIGGQLQISVEPFPRVGRAAGRFDPCANVGGSTGLIYAADFDAVPGAWTTVAPIDFHDLILGGVRTDDRSRVDARTLAKLEIGHPIYVRIVPRAGNGQLLCDPDEAGLPSEVLLANILHSVVAELPDPHIAIDQITYSAPFIYTKPNGALRPSNTETCYRVTKFHAMPGNPFLLAAIGTSWEKALVDVSSAVDPFTPSVDRGLRFCIPDSYGNDDDGWFDSFVNTFTSVLTAIVDEVGDVVNFTSKLWEDVKDGVVKVAAGAINEMGIPCDQTCEAALTTGLEIGLASMGIPPSLPNFDEIVDQGVDALAAEAGSQIGVPPVVSDYVSDEAQKFAKKAAADLKTSYEVPKLPDWLVPDIGLAPAYVLLQMHGPGLMNPFLSQPGMIRLNDPIYRGAFFKLPKRLPAVGETVRPFVFPMVLPPNTDGLPAAPAGTSDYRSGVWDKERWLNSRFANGCYHLVLTALSDPGGIYPVTNVFFSADTAAPCSP